MPSLQVSVPGQATMSTMWLAPGSGKAHGLEIAIEIADVGLADPAEHEVLLDGGANRAVGVPPDDVGQRAHLVGGDVAERQHDGRRHVARLTCSRRFVATHWRSRVVAVDRRQLARSA